MQKILPKSDLPKFVNNLTKTYQVIAPVASNPTQFKKISTFKEISLATPTQIPAKTHFQPENETLLKFEKNKTTETPNPIPETILFGLRKCDLNAIQITSKTMYDPQYLAKRKNTTLIGIHCDNPDNYCFCNSMKLENFHDIYIFPKGKNYILDIQTPKGEKLTKNLPILKKEIKIPNPKNHKKLKTLDIAKNYKNKIWENDANNCLSCSACTIHCPTCNCFDIKDILNINLKDGKRIRSSSSCQLKSFSKIAGGKSYRDSRLSRFKHFVYHKISYFQAQHNRPMCVGCGRCLRVCPTKIDWVKTINKLPKKKK